MTGTGTGGEPSEQELRAAYEEQVKQIRVEQVLLENVVTLLNLGMRRTGIAPGTEDERDPAQVRVAIESVRLVLPLLEQSAPEHLRQVRDALSQLQMAYVRIGGQPEGEPSAGPAPGGGPESGPGGEAERAPSGRPPAGAGDPSAEPKPGDPGPAQRSGRLWVPGQ